MVNESTTEAIGTIKLRYLGLGEKTYISILEKKTENSWRLTLAEIDYEEEVIFSIEKIISFIIHETTLREDEKKIINLYVGDQGNEKKIFIEDENVISFLKKVKVI